MEQKHCRSVRPAAAVFVIAGVILLCGCTASMIRKGERYEASKMYAQAFDYYYRAAVKRRGNVEAATGVKRTGQAVIDEYLATFTKLRTAGNHREAVGWYEKARAVYDRVTRLSVAVEWPVAVDEAYRNSKSIAVAEILGEKYEAVRRLMGDGKYRAAYAVIGEIKQLDPEYRDVEALAAECLSKGRSRIGIVRVAARTPDVVNTLQATVVGTIVNRRDPFVEIVDRENLVQILGEQSLAMSGVVDETAAVKAGKIAGLTAIIIMKVNTYHVAPPKMQASVVRTRLIRDTLLALEEVHEGQPATVKKRRYLGSPAAVRVVEGACEVFLSVQYQLIDTESAKVLKADIVENRVADHVKYAECGGCSYRNLSNVVPPDFVESIVLTATGQSVVSAQPDQRNFVPPVPHELYGARRELADIHNLSHQCIRESGERIGRSIYTYFAQ